MLLMDEEDLKLIAKIPLSANPASILVAQDQFYLKTEKQRLYQLKTNQVEKYEIMRSEECSKTGEPHIEEMLTAMSGLSLKEQFEMIQNLANQEKSRLYLEMDKFTLQMVKSNLLESQARMHAILVLFCYFKHIRSIFEVVCALMEEKEKVQILFQRVSYEEELRIILNCVVKSLEQKEMETSKVESWEYPLKYSPLGQFSLTKSTSTLIILLNELNDFSQLFGLIAVELGKEKVVDIAKLIKSRSIIKPRNLLEFYQACSYYKIKKGEV